MFTMTQDICNDMGMPAYEVSNHARDGAQSRHNLIYWRYGDYIGIGPGAHGRLTLSGQKYATVAYSNPQRWLDGVSAGDSEKPREALARHEQATEFLLMGLRLKEGVDVARYANLAGKDLDPEAVLHLRDLGMVTLENGHLIVSDQGVIVLNAVIETLLP
jgi:oxygen-independent coproporphyrinogen-3 oxidase